MCQAVRRFFIPFRVGISQTGIPKIDTTISGHEKKEKETYFLLFAMASYSTAMLAVLSIVPTKAAFCLMTNEQNEMFFRNLKK